MTEPIDRATLDACLALVQTYAHEAPDAFLGSFLDSAFLHLLAMQQAVADGDASALWRAAHTLRSSSAQIGATRLTAHCEALEAQGRTGDLSDAAPLVTAARAEYTQVKHVLASMQGTDEDDDDCA